MRKVISNTTPILSLLKINKIEILKELYEEVIIPNEVFLEIEKGKEKLFYADLTKFDWIRIEKISNARSSTYFFDLDKGEAEVLILANELNADLVILDELMGRRYAKQLDLNITGTIGVLLKAKELGLIESLRDVLQELIAKGTWLNPQLIGKILKMADE